ncbi:MAG: MCE family protein [Deltaproteobacteria bacterium]|nr:MCE family protein [Deltaproteobacteria bacterium]
MNSFGTEIKVGLFTLIAAGVIGYMFFVLSPDSFSSSGTRHYYTEVRDASGIVNKTHVKTNGVIVGRVSKISLQVNTTRIEFEVDENVKIPGTSVVAIREKGLLGDVFMEIIRGEDTGVYAEDGSLIAAADDQVNISALISVAGAIGKDVREITRVLSKVLGGEEGERNVTSIVSDIRVLTSETRQLVEENRTHVRNLIANLEKTSLTLKQVIGDKEEDLSKIVYNIRKTTDDLRDFSASVKGLVGGENGEKIEKIIASFDHTMQDIEVTAKNVRLVADKIERGEGTLGKLVNEDKTLTELEMAIQDVREVLAPATKLQLTVDYHGEYRRDHSTQHYFNAWMRTRPDKFFLLGFTDLTESVTETQTESLEAQEASPDATSPPVRTRERVIAKKALRFNFQFGKRWNDTQLRFGLFESTGGLAADYYLFDDSVRLSFEAFDWNNKSPVRKTAHLKAYLSILFFGHVYALIGLDDPTLYEEGTTTRARQLRYFAGAGLNFNDQDLKAIFGTAALAL